MSDVNSKNREYYFNSGMGQIEGEKLTMDIRSTTKPFSSKVTSNMLGKQNSSRRMESRSSNGDGVYSNKADKMVRFCLQCSFDNKCKVCSKSLQVNSEIESTSFHQFKVDITCFVSENTSDMIVDTGCPNSVIGIKD